MAILFSRGKDLNNFGRGSPKEDFNEIILKSGKWCRRRGFCIFSSGSHLIQGSGTILAILIEGYPRDISGKN